MRADDRPLVRQAGLCREVTADERKLTAEDLDAGPPEGPRS